MESFLCCWTMFVLQIAINCLTCNFGCFLILHVCDGYKFLLDLMATGPENLRGAETLDKQSTWKTLVGMSKQVNIALCVSASQQNTLLLLNIQDINFRGCLLLNRYTLSKNTWNPNQNIDLEHDNIVVHNPSHALIPTFSIDIHSHKFTFGFPRCTHKRS